MRRLPLGDVLKGEGVLNPPVGYQPPKSVEEFRDRLSDGETFFCYSDFSNADLSNIKLEGIYLYYSNFNNTNFSNAKLDQIKLIGSTFIGSNLSQITAEHCIMMDCDFYKANLSYSKLLFCDLRGSCFIQTKFLHSILMSNWMSGSTFNATEILGTVLSLNDLSDTKHPDRYSFVDVHSIRNSAIGLRNIMENDQKDEGMRLHQLKMTEDIQTLENFFEGCGIGAEGIDLFRKCLNSSNYQSVFISYSTKDEKLAKQLNVELRKRGIDVWFAPHNMQGGRTIREQLTSAISKQNRVILILSEHSMNSRWVETEILHSIKSDSNETQKLFPIRAIDFEKIQTWTLFDSDSGQDLARHVRSFFIPDFSNWKDEDKFLLAVEKLAEDLRSNI